MAEHNDPLIPATLHCGVCEAETQFSAALSVILLYTPAIHEPYPLITDDYYRICRNVKDGKHCRSVFTLVDRAQAAHPRMRHAGPWTRAVVVFMDGSGCDVMAARGITPMGIA